MISKLIINKEKKKEELFRFFLYILNKLKYLNYYPIVKRYKNFLTNNNNYYVLFYYLEKII